MVIFGVINGMNCYSELDKMRFLIQESHDTDFVWAEMGNVFYQNWFIYEAFLINSDPEQSFSLHFQVGNDQLPKLIVGYHPNTQEKKWSF